MKPPAWTTAGRCMPLSKGTGRLLRAFYFHVEKVPLTQLHQFLGTDFYVLTRGRPIHYLPFQKTHDFPGQLIAERVDEPLQSGKFDVFSVVFDPGDGGLLGIDPPC